MQTQFNDAFKGNYKIKNEEKKEENEMYQQNESNEGWKDNEEICFMILFCIEKHYIKYPWEMTNIRSQDATALVTPMQQLQYIATIKLDIANQCFFKQG